MGGLNLQPKINPDAYTADETIAIEAVTGTTPDTTDRLCEYDQSAQLGCYRTNVIFAFEAEFDTFVHPEMKWGPKDTTFCHNGRIYYYKGKIEEQLQRDLEEHAVDVASRKAQLDKIEAHLGYDIFDDRTSLADIKNIIAAAPAGMPKFLGETPHFFEFENPMDDDIYDGGSTAQINVNTITRPLLDQIKNTFTSEWNPLMSNLAEGLFVGKDGKVYQLDLLAWTHNPSPRGKIGVFMDPYEYQVTPYTDDHNYYPFQVLTTEETAFVSAFAEVACDNDGHELSIINL